MKPGRRALLVVVLATSAAVAAGALLAGDGAAAQDDPSFAARVAEAVEKGLAVVETVRVEHRPAADVALTSIVLHEAYGRHAKAADAAHAALRKALAGFADKKGPTRYVEWNEMAIEAIAFARRRRLVREGRVKEVGLATQIDEKTLRAIVDRLGEDMVLADGLVYGRLVFAQRYRFNYAVCTGLQALHEAADAGVGVPDDVWRRALRCVLDAREPSTRGSAGGWPDLSTVTTANGRPSVSLLTTYGGVAATAVCAAHLRGDADAALRAEALDALNAAAAWIAPRFSIVDDSSADVNDSNASVAANPMLFLACEQAFGALGTSLVGGRDWWREGAEILLARQDSQGRWDVDWASGFGGQRQPILFLLRATRAVGLVAVTPGADRLPGYDARAAVMRDAARVAARRWPALRDSGSMNAPALVMDAVRCGPDILAPLVDVVSGDDLTRARSAADLLTRLVRDDLRATLPPELVAAPPADVEAGRRRAAGWRAWLDANRGRVVVDEATWRFAPR